MEEIRLNRYLGEAGVCSRREADRLISEGRVTVNGRRAQLGDKIAGDARVEVDGQPVRQEEERVLLAFYKPEGIVCTAEKR